MTAAAGASSITVTGLENGTSYTFTITATNAVGTGTASINSTPITPASIPNAPTSVLATRGNGQATISFDAPFNGGSAITYYTVTSTGGQTATGTASGIVVTGLTNGVSYTFTVTATNALGTSPVSNPTNVIIPANTPDAPTNIVAT